MWSETTAAFLRAKRLAPLVSFGWRSYAGGDDVVVGEEGMSLAAADDVLQRASKLAQTWFAVGGRDYLSWRGTPLAAALATDVYHYFHFHLKLFAIWEHILSSFKPGRVYYCDDGSPQSRLLSHLASRGDASIIFKKFTRRPPWRSLVDAGKVLFWPALPAAARRRAGYSSVRGVGTQSATRVVFWGQLGGLEVEVYRKLQRALGSEMRYFAGTTVAARAANAWGEPCRFLFEKTPSIRLVREILRCLRKEYNELTRAGLFAGAGVRASLVSFLRANFPFRPGAYLPSLAVAAAAVEEFFIRFKPAFVVHMSDAHLTGRLMTLAAARYGVRTLVIQNHITGGPTFGYLPLTSERFAAWGEESRAWLIAGGAPADRVVVVGSPYAALVKPVYDRLVRARGNAVTVVVATNNFDVEQNRLLATTAAAYAKSRPDLNLIFRPHPSEDGELYFNVIKRYALANASVAKGDPLADVLGRAAVVVTAHSGVGVDAVLAGLPLVHVNLMAGVEDYIPYVRLGAALACRDLNSLARVMEEAAGNPPNLAAGRERFVKAYLGGDAGDPFDNIARIIREMAGDI